MKCKTKLSLSSYCKCLWLVAISFLSALHISYAQEKSVDISAMINKEGPQALLEIRSYCAEKQYNRFDIDVIAYQYKGELLKCFGIPVKGLAFLVFKREADEVQYVTLEVIPSRANEQKVLEAFQAILGEYTLGDSTVHNSKEYEFRTARGGYGFQYHPKETGREALEIGYYSDKTIAVEKQYRNRQRTTQENKAKAK